MQTKVRASPKLTRRLIREIRFSETRVLEVPWGEGWPSTWASSRRRIVGPSSSATTTGGKQVVIVVVVIVAPPARTGLRLSVGSRRLATLLAFDTLPTDRTGIGIAQPLLQTASVEPMGAVSYSQELVISLIIIQANRTSFVTTRSGPFTILSGWEARNDMTRCISWFHLAQGRSKVRQTLERVIEILVTDVVSHIP